VPTQYEPPSAAEWHAIANGAEIRAALNSIAAKGQSFAESISPRRTGDYQTHWEIHQAEVPFGGRPRAAVELANTSDHAILVELVDGHRVLGRTLDYLNGSG
jgi:hypothetical protein